MKISELVKLLEEVRAQSGNIAVYVPGGEDVCFELPLHADGLEVLEAERKSSAGFVSIPAMPKRVVLNGKMSQ